MTKFFIPQWNIADNIGAISTLRHGGVSQTPYDSLNLGAHVNDVPESVMKNRQLLVEAAQLPQLPLFLNQVHSSKVLDLANYSEQDIDADAVYSNQVGKVCAIMTADCLPVLFASKDGKEVAAAHAGWRGLCNDVLENTLAHFKAKSEDISVWLGPAIGPNAFEVGAEVREAFIAKLSEAHLAFKPSHNEGKYLANIYLLAQQRLAAKGVTQISGGDRCTFTESSEFFSYRRQAQTGRMATMIWRKA